MRLTTLTRDKMLINALRTALDASTAGDGHASGGLRGTPMQFEMQFVEISLGEWLDARDLAARPTLRVVTSDDSVNDASEDLAEAGAAPWPDVLMLDAAALEAGAFDVLEGLTRRQPRLSVLLLSADGSAPHLLAAMRAGVREVLTLPLNPFDLHAALVRAQARGAGRAPPSHHGKVYGFTACKGGSGATFIAANIAYALAADHGKRVLLIDLDLQYGDASFYFMSPEPAAGSVASVMRDAAHLDGSLLASSSLRILPNLHLLPAPEEPEELSAVTPALVARLLEAATAHYDCVLFDVSRSLDAVALAALDRADAIFAIMQSMVPDMRDARTMLRAFRQLGYPDSKLRFVVNRSDKKEDAPLRPIERGLGVDFYRTIPNDYFNASAAVNQGVAIVKLAPASPVSRVLSEIATDLTGTAGGQKTWLHKLLRRA